MIVKKLRYLLVLLLAALCVAATPALAGEPELTSWEDLSGLRVGMLTGAPFEEAIRAKNPEVEDFAYFSSMSDLMLALRSGKVDAAVSNQAIAQLTVNRNPELALFPEPLSESEMGTAFPKNSEIYAEWNATMQELVADGTAEALWQEWTSADDAGKAVPEQSWPGENGTVVVAVCPSLEPLSYMGEGGQMLGFDVEMVLACAQRLDVHVEFLPMEFSEILASLETNRADLGSASILITPERAEAVDFAVTHENDLVLVVRSADPVAAQGSFLERLEQSFERTFIKENRWQLVLSGLGITLLISACSGVLGTALGFLTVLARRKGSPLVDLLIRAFQGLMGRLPIVVVLMVFYYVVFGDVNMPGIVVAIIVFTLAFGAASGNIMWNAVSAIDSGQTEASLALGFSEPQSFFQVVLPQAARQFLPLLQAQFVSLVKDTAVVGYIAVIDLTRASDLIRSRTMEAFFPLLSTALIYFVICCILAAGVRALGRRLDLENRPREIKGVKQ